MDEKIIRLCEENNVPSLVQALSTLKNQKVVDLLEARAVEGRGEPLPYLQAVFKGSPCDTKVGLDRRTFVFKHGIQILNDGDLSNKVASEVVGFLLMELDAFPGRTLAELADLFLNAIKSGSLSNGKSLELFPKILSAVAAKEFIPMVGDGGGEMAGQEYKRHLLNTLCSSRWDPQCAIHLAAVFRDVPMTSDELRFVMEKIVRAMRDLDFQELPPLVYQLLLLSTKGHKQLVLEGITSFFNNMDNTCRKEDKEDSSEVQTLSKDQLRHMEGTVILHITFAVKQDQDLGKEFIKYLKAHQSTPGVVLTPFNMALALSIAQIHRFEETIFDFLKSAVLRSFKDEDRRKQSKWVRGNYFVMILLVKASHQGMVKLKNRALSYYYVTGEVCNLLPLHCSLFGWDHVTQGLVQLGFTLMDAFGPKIFDSTSSPNLTPTQYAYKLGSSILLDTFKAHEMVRCEILQQILNRVITKATTPVHHYIDLLASTVSSAPHVLLESLPRIKEALDYLSFLPPKSAEGFLKAIQPLLKISLSLRDSLILVLRKAMFSRQVDSRKIAVTGFLLILKHFKILGGSMPSSQSGSQLSQTLSHSSQIQVDVHVRGGGVGNEALCLEILGNLRRCLTQQADVRVQLYEGLFYVLCRNPQLQQPILDMFNNQFQKYFESDESVNPPVKVEPCLSAAGDQVYLTEPLAHLLCYLLHSMEKCIENHNQDENEENGKYFFDLLIFCLFASSAESVEEILQLFGNYHQLSEILKEKANTTGKKGRSTAGKQGAKSMLSLECSASLLRALFSDTAPSHQQSLTALRGSRDLVKYALNTALQKLKEIHDNAICSGPGGSTKENVYKHCYSGQDGDGGATNDASNQEAVYSQIKKFQNNVTQTPSRDLKQNCFLGKIPFNMSFFFKFQFNQLQAWAQRICADHNVDDPSLTKSLMSLLYSLTFQCKTSAGLVRDVAQDVHSQLGDVDEEVEVEDRTHFAIINPRTAAPTVAILLVSQIEKIVDEMDWALVKVKGDITLLVTGMAEEKVPDSPDSCPRGLLEQALCHRLCTVVAALHELSQSALPDGPCTEATLKLFSHQAKVMKEVKSVPNLIYAIEQYERYLIQLSKKSKINLMEHFKRSTARDFRINGATLEAALRQESSDEEEEHDDENDDQQDENKSEEENQEPPKKKEKIMTTNKNAGKLSLKQKASNQLLSHGNK
ncbi:Fanconi anemia group I protein-like [Orbicella faveolata]|uniref:Fanconi anemia group I protein-like n=1 Tax=Orbicella faveolata TaxID=48498 RepID=UPI0009E4B81C|nr:Fanconi anemia group I protein-like [Orbicella faveolata]